MTEITDLNASITDNDYVLSVNLSGLQYQWLNCDNGYTVINGETNQSYTVMVNGDYAVIVTDGDCIDTTDCYTVSDLAIEKLDEFSVNAFPNPTNGEINIAFNNGYSIVKVEVYDLLGQLVIQNEYDYTKLIKLNLDEASGIYIVSITTSFGDKVDIKVTKY